MQKPMWVKERDFFNDKEKYEFHDDIVKFRQSFEILSASPLPKFMTNHKKWGTEYESIDENGFDQIFELFRIHRFICSRLNFVFS